MPDLIALLRTADPALDMQPVAEPAALRARILAIPRPLPGRRRIVSRRVVVLCTAGLLAVGVTAAAARLLSAADVFSDPGSAGQGNPASPVRPVAGSERVVGHVDVPSAGRVEIWAADGSPKGTCLGVRLPNGSWAAMDGQSGGGTRPQCFVQRDDPMFQGTLVPTGIDALEVDFDGPPFERVVYGVIDADVPATAVRIVDRVTGTAVPVVDGRWFAYLDPRGSKTQDDHQLVAYDARGAIVTGEPGPGQETPLGPPRP
jgi:hypothetical protein